MSISRLSFLIGEVVGMADTTDIEINEEQSEKQLELVEHLTELRARIIRSLLYVAIGTTAGWLFYDFFFNFLSAPVIPYLKKSGSSFLLTGVAEGFTIKLQISLLIGAIIALPLVTWEGWRFVVPGLTRTERRAARLIAPLTMLLFASGVALGYYIMPVGIQWLISQNPPGAKFMPSVTQTLLFILKMYLAFGVVFQMPVVLMFLGKVGIVNSRMLKAYWRQAVVLIAIIAAVVTPSGDAFTMSVMAAPMVVLYVLSIGLVKIVEQ